MTTSQRRVSAVLRAFLVACVVVGVFAQGAAVASVSAHDNDVTKQEVVGVTSQPASDVFAEGIEQSTNSTNSSSGDTEKSDQPTGAELTLYQPHYITAQPAVGETSDGYKSYDVRGARIEMLPDNFNQSDVLQFAVEEDEATLRYNERTGQYVLDTGGNDGTYTVWWRVQETEQYNTVEDNVTVTKNRTVERRYAAKISVSDSDLSHVPASSLEQLRRDAGNWSDVEDRFEGVGPDSASIDQKLDDAARAYKFIVNPLGALTGDVTATLIMATRPGGMLVFGMLVIPLAIAALRYSRQKQRLQNKLGKYRDIREAVDEIASWQRRRLLSEERWINWFDHSTAQWCKKNLGPNPWVGLRNLLRVLAPQSIKTIALSAMLSTGEYILVTDDRNNPSTAHVESPDYDGADGDQVIRSPGAVTDGIAMCVPVEQLDEDAIGRPDADVQVSDLPIQNIDDGKLVDELGVEIPTDFQSKEQFAEVMLEIVTRGLSSEYAKPTGEVKKSRDLANLLATFGSRYGEQYDIAYMRYLRDLMLYNLDALDPAERVETGIENHERDGSTFHTDSGSDGGRE